MDATDIVVRLSGGAANSNPLNALGGAISSTAVTSQSIGTPTNVTGVVINRVVNLPSSIELYITPDGSNRYLGWIGPTSLRGYVYVTADGEYTIYSPSGDPADGYMVVTVTLASTPTTEEEDTLTVTDQTENIFPDVTSAEAGSGDDEYRCVYILNDHGSETIATLKLWVGKEYDGEETVSMAVDSNGVGGTAVTIADGDDSTNQLSGLTFTSPTTEATGITVSTIAAGSHVPIWLKRTVQDPVQNAVSNDTFGISIAAYV